MISSVKNSLGVSPDAELGLIGLAYTYELEMGSRVPWHKDAYKTILIINECIRSTNKTILDKCNSFLEMLSDLEIQALMAKGLVLVDENGQPYERLYRGASAPLEAQSAPTSPRREEILYRGAAMEKAEDNADVKKELGTTEKEVHRKKRMYRGVMID